MSATRLLPSSKVSHGVVRLVSIFISWCCSHIVTPLMKAVVSSAKREALPNLKYRQYQSVYTLALVFWSFGRSDHRLTLARCTSRHLEVFEAFKYSGYGHSRINRLVLIEDFLGNCSVFLFLRRVYEWFLVLISFYTFLTKNI